MSSVVAKEKQHGLKMNGVRWAIVLLFLLSVVVTFYRYYVGLSTTNLSDAYPWGLWIVADLTVIALAGVGFSMAIITHVFHREEYKALTRRSLLMSFLGYILVLMILIIEIGRWDNFWRPLVSPGVHSPMFEVYICILVYLLLQLIEVAEILVEKYAPQRLATMEKFMPVVVILACVVPLGHQSSLGALYLAMPGKLDPIWSSHVMPWLFLLSAFMVGPAVAIGENIWSAKRYNRELNLKMLSNLSRISAFCMMAYFIIKMADIGIRGQFGHMFDMSAQSILFILEMAFVAVIPVIISFTAFGKTRKGLIAFSVTSMLGVLLTRCNVIFTGMHDSLGGGYFPAFVEIITTVAFFAFMALVYVWITENLPFYYFTDGKTQDTKEKVKATASGFEEAI